MTTKKLLTAVSLLCLSLAIGFAQGPNGSKTYYQDANGKSGAALKTALCGVLNGEYDGESFKQISYGSGKLNGVWGAFQTTDVLSDGKTIRDRYSNISHYTVGEDQGSSSGTEATGGYNREHSFPKSWFGGSTAAGPGTDLHHIYPTDVYVNNMRQNLPFGPNKGETSHSDGYYSKVGDCTYPGSGGVRCFEPNDEWKGDFARTYFYMVTCYENSLVSWGNAGSTINGTTYPSFTTWSLNMLLEWSRNDPVSDIEVARNEAVCAIQHNRNPFIDYPGLEEYIWGTKTSESFDYTMGGFGETPTTVSTPTFSPADGTYATAQTVTISCATSGATIYYTTDGTTPSASSTEYNAAITINETTTLKAIAIKDDTESSVASATYTINTGGGDEPTPSGETLLWESFSGYTEASDGSTDINPSNENLDYEGWSSFTKVFLGKNGCGKLGSSSAVGSMEAKNIELTGSGVLTFKVLKYSSDTGKLNVTITGATANGDLQVTPESSWTEYTVNLTAANGAVGIKFATSSKRAYIDDIKLVAAATEPEVLLGDVNGDGEVTIADVTALVNILLGKDTAGYNLEAADVNSDGGRTIADVVALVKMILTK